jgi:hypothetical protein
MLSHHRGNDPVAWRGGQTGDSQLAATVTASIRGPISVSAGQPHYARPSGAPTCFPGPSSLPGRLPLRCGDPGWGCIRLSTGAEGRLCYQISGPSSAGSVLRHQNYPQVELREASPRRGGAAGGGQPSARDE